MDTATDIQADGTETEVPAIELDTPEDQQAAPVEEAENEAEPVAFTFDGESEDEDQPDDSAVIRALRERTREQARRLKELESKLPAAADDQLGPEPTLESCGYDEAEFARQHRAFLKAEAAAEAKKTEAERAQREQQEAWAKEVTDFEAKAAELRIPNFIEATQEVGDHFGDDINGQYAKVLLVKANDPRMVAALKASPAKLAELVQMKNDPARLAIALGELKGKIRAMPRRAAPAPETLPRGSAPRAPESEDKVLAKLEEEAVRTGSRTKVIAYKKQLRAAQEGRA